jgi:glyoxylate reductase
MAKPKVFVTRIIPEVGLNKIRSACDMELWPEQLPPSPQVLLEKLAGCSGVLAMLTDRFDAAVLDALPHLKVISNYAVGFNNIDIPAACGKYAWRPDRCDCRHGFLPAHRRRAPSRGRA